jgi:hydrogenase maturation protease
MNSSVKVLIQGIGNPLRGDDGLGPRFVESFLTEIQSFFAKSERSLQIDCEWVYQLQIEQAEQWAHFTHILLVDASISIDSSTSLKEMLVEDQNFPPADSIIGSHAVSPDSVFALAKEVFSFCGQVFLLSLRASRFDMGEPLSLDAKQSLSDGIVEAREFLEKLTQISKSELELGLNQLSGR